MSLHQIIETIMLSFGFFTIQKLSVTTLGINLNNGHSEQLISSLKEGLIFENEMMMVIEGNREATTSCDALVELINFCEEEMNFETFIIAIPRKRHDHREFGKKWSFLTTLQY